MTNRHSNIVYFLLIAVAVAVVFYPVVVGGEVLFFGDNLSLRLPNAIYASTRLGQGELPLWNPYIFAGIPFFADISTGTLHPFGIFFLFLDPLRALSFIIVLSLILAGAAAFLLGRVLKLSRVASLLFSLIFMFSSTLMHYTTYLNLLVSSIWLPLTLLCLHQAFQKRDKRWVAAGAISLTMQILGGHPQPTLYTLVLLFFYTLVFPFRLSVFHRLRTFLSLVLLATALCAVVLIPAAELTSLSTRSELSFETATRDSLHPLLLTRLLLPNAFDNPKIGVTWGPAWRHVSDNIGYVGIVSWLLVILTFRKFISSDSAKSRLFRFFSVAALVSLLFALGKYTPLYKAVFSILPFLKVFRGPTESLLIFNFSLALLAGLGLDHILKRKRVLPLRKIAIVSGVSAIVALLGFVLNRFAFHSIWRRVSEFHTLERDQVIAQLISSNILMASLLILASIYFLHKRKYTFIVLLVFIDLVLFNSRYIFTSPRDTLRLESDIVQTLHEALSSQQRFISYQDVEPFTGLGNYWENMVIKPPFAESFYTSKEALTLEELNSRIGDLALNWNITHSLPSPNGYASFMLTDYVNFISPDGSQGTRLNNLDLMNISQEKLNQLAVSYKLTKDGISEVPEALPRARILDYNGNLIGPAEIVVDTPERILLKASVDEPSTFVLADSYYPGWQAHVNQKQVDIEKYQGLFRSISLPQGENIIEFKFIPRTLIIGGAVTTTAIVYTIYILIVSRIQNEKKRSESEKDAQE